jgi:pimeloyl-ACP methyl ester carboxylesterase
MAPPEFHTLHCEGEGSPAIIVVHGNGTSDPLFSTNDFSNDLSRITKTCSYQRVTTDVPNTIKDIVNDLNTKTTNEQLSAPYVLVGHQCGGWISLLYAATYPEEIAGVVLLDSASLDLGSRSLEIIPTAFPGESLALTNYRQFYLDFNSPNMSTPENWDWGTSIDQVRAVTSLGDIPLLVLTASDRRTGSGIPEITQRLTDDWLAQQLEWAALSTNGRQVIVENTGHYMWEDNPSKIISLIESFIQEVRTASP